MRETDHPSIDARTAVATSSLLREARRRLTASPVIEHYARQESFEAKTLFGDVVTDGSSDGLGLIRDTAEGAMRWLRPTVGSRSR